MAAGSASKRKYDELLQTERRRRPRPTSPSTRQPQAVSDDFIVSAMRREDYGGHRCQLLHHVIDFSAELKSLVKALEPELRIMVRKPDIRAFWWQRQPEATRCDFALMVESEPDAKVAAYSIKRGASPSEQRRDAIRWAELALIQHPSVKSFENRWRVLVQPTIDHRGHLNVSICDDYFITTLEMLTKTTLARLLVRDRLFNEYVLVNRLGGINEATELLPNMMFSGEGLAAGRSSATSRPLAATSSRDKRQERYDPRWPITLLDKRRDRWIVAYARNRQQVDFRELRKMLYPRMAARVGDTVGKKRVRSSGAGYGGKLHERYTNLAPELRHRWEHVLKPLVTMMPLVTTPPSLTSAAPVQSVPTAASSATSGRPRNARRPARTAAPGRGSSPGRPPATAKKATR